MKLRRRSFCDSSTGTAHFIGTFSLWHILLCLLTRTFASPEEFASRSPPTYISVYTWPDCSLNELALELAASEPSVLPTPAIGTRLAFQLVCPDLRGTGASGNGHPRYAVKDLGSLVIGAGRPGSETTDDVEAGGNPGRSEEGKRTLGSAKFLVGDYVSCAVLPPLADGSVAPASAMRREREPREPAPPSFRDGRRGRRGGFPGRDGEFSRGGGRGGRDERRGGGGDGFPMGDWRRGERLPDGPARRSRGRRW